MLLHLARLHLTRLHLLLLLLLRPLLLHHQNLLLLHLGMKLRLLLWLLAWYNHSWIARLLLHDVRRSYLLLLRIYHSLSWMNLLLLWLLHLHLPDRNRLANLTGLLHAKLLWLHTTLLLLLYWHHHAWLLLHLHLGLLLRHLAWLKLWQLACRLHRLTRFPTPMLPQQRFLFFAPVVVDNHGMLTRLFPDLLQDLLGVVGIYCHAVQLQLVLITQLLSVLFHRSLLRV